MWLLMLAEVSSDQRMHSRLSTSWKAHHHNSDTARVEKSARHGAVQLGRSHILVLWNIVDTVDEC